MSSDSSSEKKQDEKTGATDNNFISVMKEKEGKKEKENGHQVVRKRGEKEQ